MRKSPMSAHTSVSGWRRAVAPFLIQPRTLPLLRRPRWRSHQVESSCGAGAMRHISLSALAQAFSEMGSSTDSHSHTTAAHNMASHSSSSPHYTPPPLRTDLGGGSKTRVVMGTGRSSLLSLSTPFGDHLKHKTGGELVAELDMHAKKLDYSRMIQCLVEIHRRWVGIEAAAVVEEGGRHHANVLGTSTTPTVCAHYISPEEASGSCTGYSRTKEGMLWFRSDELLLLILRCLTKLHLPNFAQDIGLYIATNKHILGCSHNYSAACNGAQPSLALWYGGTLCAASGALGGVSLLPMSNSVQFSEAGNRSDTNYDYDVIGSQFVFELSAMLQRWLAMRASSLCKHKSVTALHFLAQQSLFSHDVILATIMDTILLGGGEALSVSEISIVFDAMSRFQIATTNVLRWREKDREINDNEDGSGVGDGDGDDGSGSHKDDSISSAWFSQSQRRPHGLHLREELQRCQHPVLNKTTYNAVVEVLIKSCTMACSGNGSQKARATWNHLTPVGFLFLFRSLAKIKYFHGGMIPALLPGLAAYIRQQPEQYYPVVLLFGRSENKHGDVDVLLATVEALQCLLQRRGRMYSTRSRAVTRGSMNDVSVDLAYSNYPSGGEPVDEESDDYLLSLDLDDGDEAVINNKDILKHNHGNTKAVSDNFKVSFIDLHALPTFLSSLSHHYTLVVTASPSATHSAEEVTQRVVDLYLLLLDDIHRGVRSVSVLEHKMPLYVTERLILLLLKTSATLAGGPNNNKQQQQHASAPGVMHPLLVELAYAWTQQVGARHPSTAAAAGQQAPPITFAFRRRAREVVIALMKANVIERIDVGKGGSSSAAYASRRQGRDSNSRRRGRWRYMISAEAAAMAPRVEAATEQKRQSILQRATAASSSSSSSTANSSNSGKPVKVRTSAVFADFSEIMERVLREQ